MSTRSPMRTDIVLDGELAEYAVAVVSRALFESPIWLTWCGDEQHIINESRQLARHEAARVAVKALVDAALLDTLRISICGIDEFGED